MSSLGRIYLDRRVLIMAPLGFASGLPLLLTGGTLSAWARDAGVSLTNISLLASISTVYALKFLWAPLLDRFALPLLDRRRGWLVMFQVALMGLISSMALCPPADHPWALAAIAFLVALFSASQDIVADAYRIDILDDAQRGSAAGLFVGGYRLGMIVAGGLAFFLADHLTWPAVYALMGLLMSLGILATLLAPAVQRSANLPIGEPRNANLPIGDPRNANLPIGDPRNANLPIGDPPNRKSKIEDQKSDEDAPVSLVQSVVPPLRQLLLRPNAWAMLLFILLFKLPDVLGNSFSVPFLLDIGVTKPEIGFIRNTYGLALTIVGALAGAGIVSKLGLKPSLWLFGLLQAASNAGYLLLSHFGSTKPLLLSVISVENFCGGLVTAGFSIYLMAQCDRRYSAFQFALLTSAMALSNFLLAPAGYAADHLGWPTFFLLTIAAALPGMATLPWVRCDEPNPVTQPDPEPQLAA